MPKKTFFNLSTEKQEMIISQSIKAFARGTYNEIKISTIIKMSDIPRASFYDYFEDKMDLYKYILIQISKKKENYMASCLEEDFFSNLRQIICSSVRFMLSEPELEIIFKHFISNKELVEEVFGENNFDVSEYLMPLLEKGKKSGSLREDIDIKFAAKSISILSSQLMLEEISNNGCMEEAADEIADKVVDFIKFGIGKS